MAAKGFFFPKILPKNIPPRSGEPKHETAGSTNRASIVDRFRPNITRRSPRYTQVESSRTNTTLFRRLAGPKSNGLRPVVGLRWRSRVEERNETTVSYRSRRLTRRRQRYKRGCVALQISSIRHRPGLFTSLTSLIYIPRYFVWLSLTRRCLETVFLSSDRVHTRTRACIYSSPCTFAHVVFIYVEGLLSFVVYYVYPARCFSSRAVRMRGTGGEKRFAMTARYTHRLRGFTTVASPLSVRPKYPHRVRTSRQTSRFLLLPSSN